MPLLIGILVVLAAMYQLFFRYDNWQSDEKPGVMYERDNLTGDTKTLKAGAKVSVFARIMGKNGSSANIDTPESDVPDTRGDGQETRYLEPLTDTEGSERYESTHPAPSTDDTARGVNPDNGETVNLRDTKQVAKISQPVPVPKEVVVASSAPPVPVANIASDSLEPESWNNARPFAVRQIDLDRDGAVEEVIQNAKQSDGMLDISIVKNGREIFYGRGKQISLLPTSNRGWADIALKLGSQTLQVFRYNTKDDAYKMLDRS